MYDGLWTKYPVPWIGTGWMSAIAAETTYPDAIKHWSAGATHPLCKTAQSPGRSETKACGCIENRAGRHVAAVGDMGMKKQGLEEVEENQGHL